MHSHDAAFNGGRRSRGRIIGFTRLVLGRRHFDHLDRSGRIFHPIHYVAGQLTKGCLDCSDRGGLILISRTLAQAASAREGAETAKKILSF